MATAQHRQLTPDGDGVCMLCKNKPADDDKLICNTCATPWHLTCLSVRPETLASALQWECPDCAPAAGDVPAPLTGAPSVSSVSETSSELIVAIRAIEADESLTSEEKARKRQKLMSRGCRSADLDDSKSNNRKNGKNDVVGLLDESLNCSFCMQLLDRPVTASDHFLPPSTC